MICSFTLYLKPLNYGERILKYKNYDYICEILKKEFSKEELKLIVVSNFLTSDKNVEEEKRYSIKISSIRGEIALKLYRCFFLKSIEREKIKIGDTEFIILNIYNNNKYAKQLEFDIEKEIGDSVRIKFLTPTFFKVGNRYASNTDLNFILKNIEKKLKKSDIEGIKLENSVEYTIKNEDIKERDVFDCGEGMIGEIEYDLSNVSEDDKRKIHFILQFAFFSGVGYMTEKGYGQIEFIE